MYIIHTIHHHLPHLLQAPIAAHDRDGTSLDQDEAAGQQLKGLQCCAIRAKEPLPPLDKALLVPDQAANLDDVARNVVVVHYAHSLLDRDGAGDELDEVAGAQDGGGVPGLAGGLDGERALDSVELRVDSVLVACPLHQRPARLDVHLAVLWEQDRERRLLEQRPAFVVARLERRKLCLSSRTVGLGGGVELVRGGLDYVTGA